MASDRPSSAPLSTASVSLRLTSREPDVAGCFVELHLDGHVVLVVDGERLFRFESLDALLAQYDLVRGATRGDAADQDELLAAELAVNVAVAAIEARPRSQKTLVDERVALAIERVRNARSRLGFPP